MKSLQQLRINQFLHRVPKPKKIYEYIFSNDLVKKLYSKAENEILKKDFELSKNRILTMSLSTPKLSTSPSAKFSSQKQVLRLQKQLFNRVNPNIMKNGENKNLSLNSSLQKKYLVDSISHDNETIDVMEKEKNEHIKNPTKPTESSSIIVTTDDLRKKKTDFIKNSRNETHRYVLTSPKNLNKKKSLNIKEITIREKEILSIELKKYFKQKNHKSYKLI